MKSAFIVEKVIDITQSKSNIGNMKLNFTTLHHHHRQPSASGAC